jgi:hypothetical protein
MHVCQIMLVEASNVEDAFSEVYSRLSEGEPRWSDWSNVGSEELNYAGRWTGSVFGTPNAQGVYDADEAPNYLQYSSDPALAERAITEYLEHRLNDIRSYQAKAMDLKTFTYDPYSTKFDMDLWATKKLAQLLDDEWTCDTGIYDLNDWTGNLRSFVERVKTNPEQQWLIPVDFHF